MFSFFNYIKSKFELVKIFELVIVVVSTLGSIGLLHFLFGKEAYTYMWLLFLTLWIYFHTKKDRKIWDRFGEIDERDMEFHDDCEKRIEKLEKTK